MKTWITAGLLATAIATPAAWATECVTFTSGEILCDDGRYAYYWSPQTGQWQVLDRAATAAALGLSTDSADAAGDGGGSVTYDGNGGALTTTGDGCTMFSAPGYSYGDSLSFSSGC